MDKQRILDEIQRTAAENGGQPLGRSAFLKATGIKEVDWRGRYWARWNDAVSEAGFAPNELNAAHESDHLLSKLADLVIDLGRFPTASEMQLKRRADATFPSQKVYDRFGDKIAKIVRLRAFCMEHPQFSNVLALCPAPVTAENSDVGAAVALEDGYVYLALMKVC